MERPEFGKIEEFQPEKGGKKSRPKSPAPSATPVLDYFEMHFDKHFTSPVESQSDTDDEPVRF